MSDRARAEVLIVGGGHAGLLLGGALAAAGVSVLLVERQPRSSIVEARSDGRTLALLAGSVALFRRLGAWSRVGRKPLLLLKNYGMNMFPILLTIHFLMIISKSSIAPISK